MKKVLFLIPTLMHGGAEKVLVNLVNHIDKTKFDVTLYSLFDEGVNKDFLSPEVHYKYKFKKVFRGYAKLASLFNPSFLFSWLVKDQYDIVVSYLEGSTTRIAAGCNDPKTKKVAWIHIELNDPYMAKIGFKSKVEARRYYETFDAVAGVSERVVHLFSKNVTESVRTEVLYNTNDTVLIRQMASAVPAVQLKDTTINLVSVAKIVKTKGYDRLMDVHKRLLDEGFEHTVNILGIGEELAVLQKKAMDLGLQDSFRFLGFHKNPYAIVAQGDLYICSSFREGFSTAVSEALILGIPVVSTDCSGAREMLGDDEFGIVMENSEEGIYQGLKRMLSDMTTLAHYKEQAAVRGTFFSTQNTVNAVEDFLTSLT